MKHLKTLSMILIITLLSAAFFISCNLDGSGIFIAISDAEASTTTDYSSMAVQNILNIDAADNMFIRMSSGIKVKDYTDDDALWDDVTALNGKINDVEFDGEDYYFGILDGTTVDLYTLDDTLSKDTVLGDLTALGINDINLSTIFTDDAHTFAVYFDDTNIMVSAFEDGAKVTENIVEADGYTPKLNSFAINDGTVSHVFVNILNETSEEIFTYHLIYDGTSFTSTDNAVTNSDFEEHLIGGFYDAGKIYIFVNDGNIFDFTSAGLDFATINDDTVSESILADPDDEKIDIGKNSSGYDIVRSSGVPYVLVEDAEDATDTDRYVLIAGDEDLFEINLTDFLTDGSVTPTEVETESGTYYYAMYSTRITDFYDNSGSADWAFFSATSDTFVVESTEEEASSSVLP